MKIVQVINNMVFCVLPENTMAEAEKHYNVKELKEKNGVVFVETENDNVKQQWFYDRVTNTFCPPIPPEGFGYDEGTGVFFELNPTACYAEEDSEKVAMAEFIVSI